MTQSRVTSVQIIGLALPIVSAVVAWILIQMVDSSNALATQKTQLEQPMEDGADAQRRIRNIELDVTVIRSDVTHQGEQLSEIDDKIDTLLQR